MSILALIIACGAVALAFYAPFYNERTLRRAFNQLEDDFDSFTAEVRGVLGRTARLKGLMKQGKVDVPSNQEGTGAAASPSQEPTVIGGRPLTRSQLLSRSKQHAESHGISAAG